MTPRLFMEELKGVDFSCTSPSSVSTDAATTTTSISYNSILTTSGIGGRAIDRCSPRLRDPLRAKALPRALPDKSKTFNQKAKKPSSDNKRSTQAVADPASSRRYLLSDCDSEDFSEQELVGFVTVNEPAELRFRSLKVEELVNVVEEHPSRFQSVKVEESKDISLPSSSSSSSTSKRAEEQKQDEEQHPSKLQSMKGEETKDKGLPAAASSTRRAQEQQVVVLRVSLHCKGCEGKVRKHISKMQGVTSFSTDLVNKKVTVIGEVTPLGVLNSISKVKNAQLWSS